MTHSCHHHGGVPALVKPAARRPARRRPVPGLPGLRRLRPAHRVDRRQRPRPVLAVHRMRPRMDHPVTARLIPDLDDELTAALNRIEELLMEVAAWEDEDPDTAWPVPLARGQALAALRRTWDAVAPAQGERAVEAGRTGRLLAPDGRYEHAPLRLVDVGQADVDALAAAAAIFGDPHAPGHVRQALEHGADIAYHSDDDQACTQLVMTAAQLAGLLDLTPDRDSEMLAALVEDSDPGADVVLSPAGEAAYQRYATRANHMWSLSDPLARYLY